MLAWVWAWASALKFDIRKVNKPLCNGMWGNKLHNTLCKKGLNESPSMASFTLMDIMVIIPHAAPISLWLPESSFLVIRWQWPRTISFKFSCQWASTSSSGHFCYVSEWHWGWCYVFSAIVASFEWQQLKFALLGGADAQLLPVSREMYHALLQLVCRRETGEL